jgi:hypothetical protein
MEIIPEMTQTGNNKTTVCTDKSLGQKHHNGTENTDASISPCASLLKACAREISNGSNLRSITHNRPSIYTPFTNPKKGNGSHKIKDIFAGKKDYHYNDHLTAAFVELAELSRKAKQPLIAVTCTFNDATHIELKKADTEDEARTIIEKFKRKLTGEAKDRNKPTYWNVDCILIIEKCKTSTVPLPSGDEEKRLHVHIITYGDSNEQERLKAILAPFSKQTMIQDTWTDKREYSAFDEMDEDQFGDIPTGEPESNNKHWLNTYKTKDKQGNQWVHTILPVCLRGVDYITKGLNKQIGDGRNFTLIGLKNAPKRRLELFKQGQALGKPTKDWSLTSYPVQDTNQLDVQPAVMAPAESKVLEEIDPMQSNPENIRHQNLKSASEPAESPDSKNLPEYGIWS